MTRARNSRRRRTGAAFLEALATLPVLALIFAGALAVNAMYSAKLEAKARARRIAWLQADLGDCHSHACASAECRGAESELDEEGLAPLSTSGAGRFSLRSFIGDVGRFLVGTVTHGYGSATAPTPSVFGSQTEQRGKTTLVCNTKPSQGAPGRSGLEHACETGLGSTEFASEACP